MMNRDYILPVKQTGPSNSIAPDGQFYGNIKWTWNFDNHFPVMTVDYAENQTGRVLTTAAGSLSLAEANLLKIAKIAKSYIFAKVALVARNHLEYRIAHDTELINDMIQFQLEILQTWGGYESLYRVTDSTNQTSIGKAAEVFAQSLDVYSTYYTWRLDPLDIRSGY